MLAELCRQIGGMMRSWWLRDRIRVSPVEGELLRLQPGDLLTCRGHDVEVVQRNVSEGPDGVSLRLACETPEGPTELQIQLNSMGAMQGIVWRDANGSRCVHAEDFEVWPRQRMV